MPDPVGEAIVSLLDRIEFLEARLTHLQGDLHRTRSPAADAAA